MCCIYIYTHTHKHAHTHTHITAASEWTGSIYVVLYIHIRLCTWYIYLPQVNGQVENENSTCNMQHAYATCNPRKSVCNMKFSKRQRPVEFSMWIGDGAGIWEIHIALTRRVWARARALGISRAAAHVIFHIHCTWHIYFGQKNIGLCDAWCGCGSLNP